jgi:hypothetical protein
MVNAKMESLATTAKTIMIAGFMPSLVLLAAANTIA